MLSSLPYINPEALTTGSPILHPDLLQRWPAEKHPVNPLEEAYDRPQDNPLLRVFNGPRVVFPDGLSRREPNVRAYYYDGPASFTHSIGVIASNDKHDTPLLKFAAVYLRSSLARYFLMLRTWKILCSRNGFHLNDIKTFPYFEPDAAPSPEMAQRALVAVSCHMDRIAKLPYTDQPAGYQKLRQELDQHVYAYFGLTREEQALVEETVSVLMPSIRPRSLDSLQTPAQRKVGLTDYMGYAKALGESLTRWRTRMGGQGHFHITANGSEPARDGPSGIVRIDYVRDKTADPAIDTLVDDEVVLQTLAMLRKAGLRRIWSAPSLSLVPDTHIWLDGSLYLVRPAIKRNWTLRQALRDAEHIVRLTQPDMGI